MNGRLVTQSVSRADGDARRIFVRRARLRHGSTVASGPCRVQAWREGDQVQAAGAPAQLSSTPDTRRESRRNRNRKRDRRHERAVPRPLARLGSPLPHSSLAHRHAAADARQQASALLFPVEGGRFRSRSALKKPFATVASAIGLRKPSHHRQCASRSRTSPESSSLPGRSPQRGVPGCRLLPKDLDEVLGSDPGGRRRSHRLEEHLPRSAAASRGGPR
jgi:hypothetical protein